MMPNREGLFHAYPAEIGLGETKENKLLQVVIKYRLFEELSGGEVLDCSSENFEICGFHILEKRDHTLNTTTVDALKAALGWDGCDPFWLQDNAGTLSQQPVQVKLVVEEYNGQKSLKVAFLNPYGSKGGGVPKADDSMRKAVGNRLGPKFRAVAGGSPAPAPKPAGKPMPSNPAPVPTKPAMAKAPAATSTMELAWDAFVKTYTSRSGGNDEDMQQQWFTILGELFPGRQPGQLSPADWGVMRDRGPSEIIPF